MVKIKLTVSQLGLFHGVNYPKRGDELWVERWHAARYYAFGYAQPAEVKELGRPYQPWLGAA